MFQVQAVTGSSIPFSPLEASAPKCFPHQVLWTLSFSRQERYQPPSVEHKRASCQQRQQFPWTLSFSRQECYQPRPHPLLSRSEHVQHVNNSRSATSCQKRQPFQGRRISRMPETTMKQFNDLGQTNYQLRHVLRYFLQIPSCTN